MEIHSVKDDSRVVKLPEHLELVSCDLCGASKSSVYASQTDLMHKTTTEMFHLVRCEQCDLIYTNPRPTRAAISRYYSNSYSFHLSQNSIKIFLFLMIEKMANSKFIFLVNFFPFLHRFFIARIKPQVSDPVRTWLKEKKNPLFIDIGCGNGTTVHFWGPQSSLLNYSKLCRVEGVELSDFSRESLKSKDIVCYSDIEKIPIENSYDVIRMNWSLEHVHNPTEYLSFIKRHLKKDGHALLTVPNINGIINKMAPGALEVPVHLYHFSPTTLEALAKKVGLTTVKIQTFSYPASFYFAKENFNLLPEFSAMSPSSARQLQKVLDCFDQQLLGNDIVIELVNKEYNSSVSREQ